MEVSFVDEVALELGRRPTPEPKPPPAGAAPAIRPGRGSRAGARAGRRARPTPARPALRRASSAPPRARTRATGAVPKKPGRAGGQQSRGARLADLNPRRPRPRPPPIGHRQPPGAVMSAQAAANIAQAITRQVQPCADRQVYPGPGAERIVTSLALSLNPDGSLRGRPRMTGQRGIDDENRRYAQRVADLAVNAFVVLLAAARLAARIVRRSARLEQFHDELPFARMRMNQCVLPDHRRRAECRALRRRPCPGAARRGSAAAANRAGQ